MFPLLLLSAALWHFSEFSLYQSLEGLTTPLKKICVAQFETPHLEVLGSAMVCGQDLGKGPLKELFLRLGLYHVLVVSGAHLVFLSLLLQRLLLHSPRWLAIALLFGFAMMTGLQAPVVRAGLQIWIQSQCPRTDIENLFLSWLGCLIFHPPWLGSMSLSLSVLAGLGLIMPGRPWMRAIWIVLFTLPVVLPLGSFSLWGAVCGILLSPIFELLLFPLCLLAWLIPAFSGPLELVLEGLISLLQSLGVWLPSPVQSQTELPRAFLWVYVGLLIGLRRQMALRPSMMVEQNSRF